MYLLHVSAVLKPLNLLHSHAAVREQVEELLQLEVCTQEDF